MMRTLIKEKMMPDPTNNQIIALIVKQETLCLKKEKTKMIWIENPKMPRPKVRSKGQNDDAQGHFGSSEQL